MVNFTVSSKIITVVLKIIFWIVNLYVCIMEAIVIIQFQSLHTYTAMDALYYTNMIEWKGNKSHTSIDVYVIPRYRHVNIYTKLA